MKPKGNDFLGEKRSKVGVIINDNHNKFINYIASLEVINVVGRKVKME